MEQIAIGLDIGAENCKLVEIILDSGTPRIGRCVLQAHHKRPFETASEMLQALGTENITWGAVTGRGGYSMPLLRLPVKVAAGRGLSFLYPGAEDLTMISIGSHGFYLLERRPSSCDLFRENARCSQGTGNFLKQLVERFGLTVEEASERCAHVTDPAPLSGRCPVILKTDMTHLANKGEDQNRILAGLYDAVCENVHLLVRPEADARRVILTGGVATAERIRTNFKEFLKTRGMTLLDQTENDRFIEAIGAAMCAIEQNVRFPAPEVLAKRPESEIAFERLEPLALSRGKVRRMTAEPMVLPSEETPVYLGFDIGSTGSKAVAVDAGARKPLWEGYCDTSGKPVEAAQFLTQKFLNESKGLLKVVGVGATGSGREIVGSMIATCFGAERVYVLNEIAAHGEGALYFDSEVDTIFEIGGQDAKYIRLSGGRICDAAMNEACSAGTGSFIAEQGHCFPGISDVVQMGRVALEADQGISLGQHCSVFMAEVIDEAVSAGVDQSAIVAGIYDSIIQNYLNRVKGNRSVGQRIFCQGMPFASDALACAVARQTGSEVVVPPNPGTIGALGIALLAQRHLTKQDSALDLGNFLAAKVISKDVFTCKSTQGCGGSGASGNRCRIDRLKVETGGEQKTFLWGGSCSLYDQGVQRRKLPNGAPNPFSERQALVQAILDKLPRLEGRPRIAVCDEFSIKGLLPFFAPFLSALGFALDIHQGHNQSFLKRGIEAANVPFCAPVQLMHGLCAEIALSEPDFVFLPMMIGMSRVSDEAFSTTCPLAQALPDLLAEPINWSAKTKILAPRFDMTPGNLASELFQKGCESLANSLGCTEWRAAYEHALKIYEQFVADCMAAGARALQFARENNVSAVVVLGRPYTIYNPVLNSNVPNLLREQGTIAIPVECYPVVEEHPAEGEGVPVFRSLFWGTAQQILRAAHQIRRREGEYAVFTSNYSCGPDSFNLHFFSYIMRGKPFAIVETDGHSGDAGTKTRLEAFLYCVEQDRRLTKEERAQNKPTDFSQIEAWHIGIMETKQKQEIVELPPMGIGSVAVAAVLRGEGFRAEVLPLPNRETLQLGRKYSSGKECQPLIMTMGSILQRVLHEPNPNEKFAFFMPTADGPCRFGMYNHLHKIVFEQLGWKDRLQIVAPGDTDYFEGMPPDLEIRVWLGFVASDALLMALHDTRPCEKEPGAAQKIFDRSFARLITLLERMKGGSLLRAMGELGGRGFGVYEILEDAAREFAEVKDFRKNLPTVSLVGEIYCRLEPFTNNFLIDKLESRGLKVRMAPFNEWLEYVNHLQRMRISTGQGRPEDDKVSIRSTAVLMEGVGNRVYEIMGNKLCWPKRTTVRDSIAACEPYLSEDLRSEAILTLGAPLHELHHKLIDGVVAVCPHECMPGKISEAQYCHISETYALPVLTIPLNGDGVDLEALDAFCFEVKARFERNPDVPSSAPKRIAAVETPDKLEVSQKFDEISGQVLRGVLKVLSPIVKAQEKIQEKLPLQKLMARFKGEKPTCPACEAAKKEGPGYGPGTTGLRWPPTEENVPRS